MDNSISASQANIRPPSSARGNAVTTTVQDVGAEQKVAAAVAIQPPREVPVASSEAMSRDKLEALSQRLNEFVQEHARELEFQVDQDGGRVVILVRQSETGEVLRTIPPDEALELVGNLGEGAAALVSQLA